MSYVEKRPWLGFTLIPQDEELHNLEFHNRCKEMARRPRWWNILIKTEVESNAEVKSCELQIRPPQRMDLTQLPTVLTSEIDNKLHEQGVVGYTAIHVRAFIVTPVQKTKRKR